MYRTGFYFSVGASTKTGFLEESSYGILPARRSCGMCSKDEIIL